jgi:hypothetical protein
MDTKQWDKLPQWFKVTLVAIELVLLVASIAFSIL